MWTASLINIEPLISSTSMSLFHLNLFHDLIFPDDDVKDNVMKEDVSGKRSGHQVRSLSV